MSIENFIEDYHRLEDNKIEAIETTEGPLLIIAGPGSGKTLTMVWRLVYLLAAKKIEPENIFFATFTEKAAKELLTRASNKLLEIGMPVNLNEMYLGTLHSVFLRILEEYRDFTRLSKNYRILDDFDQKYLIYDNLTRFNDIENSELLLKNKNGWKRADIIAKYVSKIAEEFVDIERLMEDQRDNIRIIGSFCSVYEKLLQEENALDFSAIQTEFLRLLNNNPDILTDIRSRIKYIMVDEYQDTNTIQERILFKLLNPDHNNICVVGDDDQGLYRFRGASIRNILEFRKNFKPGECKEIKLETNFRSHPGIIKFYNEWMDRLEWSDDDNTYRFDKEIKPREDVFPEYESVISVSSLDSERAWHFEVKSFLDELISSGILKDYNQVAFLFRSVRNDEAINLANFLEKQDIKVFSPRSALFFERREIKLIIGCLVMVFPKLFETLKINPGHDVEAWGYYKECAKLLAGEIRDNPSAYKELQRWLSSTASRHLHLTGRTGGFSEMFYQIMKFYPFAYFLESDLNANVIHLRAVYNLALFSHLISKFEFYSRDRVLSPKNIDRVLRKFFNNFLHFLYDGGINEFEDFDEYAPTGCVSFMTIHQSKGLEFPVVIVGSLHQRPRKQYDDIDVILQEEYYGRRPFEPLGRTKYFDFYRLFYTAFSRPQNLLVLTGFIRGGRWPVPSKYFQEAFYSLPEWHEINFDPAFIKLETIKPVNIKKEYAFTSHIQLYNDCPLQYKFYKELDFAEIRTGAYLFGNLVHQTIEDIHRHIIRGESDKVTDENIEIWFNKNYNSLSKSFRADLAEPQQKVALRHVKNYRDRSRSHWDRIKEAEYDVSLVMEKYILKGSIDLIEGDDNTVEIIDFKSQKNKPDINTKTGREELEQYRRQLEVYAHIVEGRLGLDVSKMMLFYTGEESGNPYVSFPKNKMGIDKTISEFDAIVAKIEAKDFDNSAIRKTEKLCGNCDMRYYCRVK